MYPVQYNPPHSPHSRHPRHPPCAHAPYDFMDEHPSKRPRINDWLVQPQLRFAHRYHRPGNNLGSLAIPQRVCPPAQPLQKRLLGNIGRPSNLPHHAAQLVHKKLQNALTSALPRTVPPTTKNNVAVAPKSEPPERPWNCKDEDFKKKVKQFFDWVEREIPRKTVYAVKENLGEGGFGRAVQVDDNKNQSSSKSVIKMFVKETDAAEEIRMLKIEIGKHPNIIAMLNWQGGASPISGISLLLLEFCDVGNLSDYRGKAVRLHQALQEDVIWHIILSLAKALAYLHSGDTRHSDGMRPGPQYSAIVHRDIKPENILLRTVMGQPGNIMVKLGDFGLAKRLTRGGDGTWEDSCSNGGTHQWQASEQVKHPHYAGPAQDVWSMGAILHYLALGEPPINMTQADNKLEHNSPAWKASIPRRVTYVSWAPHRRKGLGKQKVYLGDGHLPWSRRYSIRLNQWMKKMLDGDVERRIMAQAVVTGMSKTRRR